MPDKTIKRRLIEAGDLELAGCMTHCGFVLGSYGWIRAEHDSARAPAAASVDR
jgi:hypothetical protein